jgi:hypothetical protein
MCLSVKWRKFSEFGGKSVNFYTNTGLSSQEDSNLKILPAIFCGVCGLTKYMVMSRDRHAQRSHSMKNDNSSFERVEEFNYLGTTVTNQNSIQEEIKGRLKSGNVCYHSVQNLLSSSLISKNLKIKIYRTIILPVVLYGCETWLLTLREERRLKLFENRVLRRIHARYNRRSYCQ